jgi:hypothetical protein
MNVVLLNGFLPRVGGAVEILWTTPALAGTFTTFNGPDFSPTRAFIPVRSRVSLTLWTSGRVGLLRGLPRDLPPREEDGPLAVGA